MTLDLKAIRERAEYAERREAPWLSPSLTIHEAEDDRAQLLALVDRMRLLVDLCHDELHDMTDSGVCCADCRKCVADALLRELGEEA